MTSRVVDYGYIAGTIVLTVFGQLILKWRMDQVGPLPAGAVAATRFLLVLLVDPFVLASFASAFLAGLCWMAAMTRFELSYAYPFTSLSFALVLALGVVFLGESLTFNKALGIALIVIGTMVAGADRAVR